MAVIPAAAEPGPGLGNRLDQTGFHEAFVSLSEHSKLGTQDADPLGAGAWQFQVNYGHQDARRRWNGDWRGATREQASAQQIEAAFTYGVSDTLDLGVAAGYAELKDDASGLHPGSGHTDVVLSAKWRFRESASRHLAFAFIPALTIPVGATSTAHALRPGQDFWGLDLRFAVVKDWSPRLSTNLDVGYEGFFGDRGESLGGFGANLAVGYHLMPWFQPQLELHYGHDFARVAPDADLLAVTIGAIASVSDAICIRTGLQQGVVGRHADKLRTFLLSMDVNF